MGGKNQHQIDMLDRVMARTTGLQPTNYPFGGGKLKKPSVDMEHQVLLLKVNKLEEKLDEALDLIRELTAAKYPRLIGTSEACRVLGISRSTLMARISKGAYPFAFKDKESGEWRFNLLELNLHVNG